MKRRLLTLIVSTISLVPLCSQTTLHLSPKGNDKAAGTKNAPMRTIQAAVNRSNSIADDVIIELHDGVYRQTKTIEIGESALRKSLLLRNATGAEVSVTGDLVVPLSAVRKVKDSQALNRMQEESKGKVVEIDFTKLSTQLDGLRSVGFGRANGEGWSELVVNGKSLQLSRWPNDSTQLIGKVLVSGNTSDKEAGNLPVFQFDTDRPKMWMNAPKVWLSGYFGHGYADDMIPVKEISLKDSTFHMADFTVYHFMTGESFRRWYAVNLLEEIDMPGEYAIEAERNRIYFMPEENQKIESVRLLTLSEPLFAIENARHVTIRGITIENARSMGVYIENSHHIRVDSCTLRNLGNVAICMGQGNEPAKKEFTTGKHAMESGGEQVSRKIGDMMGRIYQDVLLNRNAGTDIGVMNCKIYDVGAGGVLLSGGDRRTLTPAGNFVENCLIYNYNRIEKSYRPGVWIDGVGNRVTKCNIFDAPSMAILFHGNDHVIEYSKIMNVCTEVDDQGAIYYGRDPSERGHHIRYNYFGNFDPTHRVSATYHDDGACGAEVYGNVYFNAGSLPVLIGGGKDNHYRNNIFIGSPITVHLDNRMKGWGMGMTARGGIMEQRLKQVKFDEPPYATAYPELVNYWSEDAAQPMRNTFSKNLFYKTFNVLSGQSSWGEFWNNWIVTQGTPGFVDEEDPLKGFVEGAAIFKRIEGFEPIPFEEIGCEL
ncbi:MAG: right-handed parallel beta-helix repeat-containing protein [Phocaeicola sp.]